MDFILFHKLFKLQYTNKFNMRPLTTALLTGLAALVLSSNPVKGQCSGEYSPDANTKLLYHFNEGSGTIVEDSSGNGNLGTLNNVEWSEGSIYGHSAHFNGLNSVVSVIKTPSVDITDEITLEAWIKRDSYEDGMVISKNGPYFISVRDNKVEGGIYSNDGNCPTSCTTPGANTWLDVRGFTNLDLNEWYHIAMTYDTNEIKIYLNGALENSEPKTGQMPQVSQGIHLGWGEPGQNQYFNGTIDEVRLSDVVRDFYPCEPIANETLSWGSLKSRFE
jgi:hypothetical protein